MSLATYDIKGPRAIERGFPWRFAFTRRQKVGRQPVDLSGCAARLEIRDTASPHADTLTYASADGKIILGGAAGTVEVRLTGIDTAAIRFRHAVRYRLIFTNSLGEDEIYLSGNVQVEGMWP